jgi:hypothetical protein
MSSKATSNRSGVSRAEIGVGNVSVLAPVERRISADGEPASARIRRAHGLLADLLSEDEFEHENGLLLGAVSEPLNRILLELDQISGMQRLFELWVQDAP